jgi:peptidoglycan/LPS O-acetylase OafA/YrhL
MSDPIKLPQSNPDRVLKARGLATYLPTLDGWRALAIALVLFSHASDSIQNAIPPLLFSNADALKKVGLFGVQLFFGLSGFLITSKLIDEECRRGQISLASFYIRRGFRILPAATMFLSVAGFLALCGIINISPGRWLSTLFFAANYSPAEHSWYLGHFWSLAVEEHFYFLWPAAFLFLRTSHRRLAWAIFLALFIALWRAVDFKYQVTGSSPAVFWGRTDIQADSILWGVLIALLYGDPRWKERLHLLFSLRSSWPILFIVLFGLELIPASDWKLGFFLISIKSMLIPLVMLGTVIQSSNVPGRILETSVFRWLGRLSYSLYLWQQLFLVWNEERVSGLGFLQLFPYNILALFVCATLSMLWIESPLIALGHRMAKRTQHGSLVNTSRV